MTLKLIGAGYGRTGTDSTKEALNILGLPCYHMREILANKANRNHLDFWCKVADSEAGSQHDWPQVFANYQATLDNPAACVWQELVEAYPDAKVLLTLHPGGAESWYDSVMSTIYVTELRWQWRIIERILPFAQKFGPMARKLVWQRFHKDTMKDRDAAIKEYHRHVAEVKATVPADKLLAFKADEGWAPLCDFLGIDIPNEPFPRVNDRESMQKAIKRLVLAANVFLVLVASGLIAGLTQLYRALVS